MAEKWHSWGPDYKTSTPRRIRLGCKWQVCWSDRILSNFQTVTEEPIRTKAFIITRKKSSSFQERKPAACSFSDCSMEIQVPFPWGANCILLTELHKKTSVRLSLVRLEAAKLGVTGQTVPSIGMVSPTVPDTGIHFCSMQHKGPWKIHEWMNMAVLTVSLNYGLRFVNFI